MCVCVCVCTYINTTARRAGATDLVGARVQERVGLGKQLVLHAGTSNAALLKFAHQTASIVEVAISYNENRCVCVCVCLFVCVCVCVCVCEREREKERERERVCVCIIPVSASSKMGTVLASLINSSTSITWQKKRIAPRICVSMYHRKIYIHVHRWTSWWVACVRCTWVHEASLLSRTPRDADTDKPLPQMPLKPFLHK